MNKTAIIYSHEEAIAMKPHERPMCYRIPSKIYHDTFVAVGAASMCWTPKPSSEVFSPEEAEKVAVELLFNIACELEKAGLTYENWPTAWNLKASEADSVSRGNENQTAAPLS